MPEKKDENVNSDKDIKRVFKNLFSLFFLRGSLHFLHFITYPFLMRMLGVERFGLVVFGQSVIMFFSIITDFGFNLSAVKQVSVEREDKKRVEEVFNSVFLVKIFLAIITFVILLVLINFVEKFKAERLFFLLMYGYLVGYVIFPIWFFQGMEDMKYITYFNLIGRFIYTVLLFVFIRKPGDYLLVPIFLSVSMILTGLFSFVLAIKKYNLRIFIPSFQQLWETGRKSFHFFLSNLFVSLYNYSNVIFIGLFLGNEAAGLYSMAEKIFQAVTSLYYPLHDSLYPYMAKFKNFSFYKKIFRYSFLLNVVMLSVIIFTSKWIILIVYGKTYVQSVTVLKILSACGVIYLPALLLGYPLLGVSGKDSLVNNSIIFASVLHVGLLLIISPLATIYLVAALTIFTQLILLLIRLYGISKVKLI